MNNLTIEISKMLSQHNLFQNDAANNSANTAATNENIYKKQYKENNKRKLNRVTEVKIETAKQHITETIVKNAEFSTNDTENKQNADNNKRKPRYSRTKRTYEKTIVENSEYSGSIIKNAENNKRKLINSTSIDANEKNMKKPKTETIVQNTETIVENAATIVENAEYAGNAANNNTFSYYMPDTKDNDYITDNMQLKAPTINSTYTAVNANQILDHWLNVTQTTIFTNLNNMKQNLVSAMEQQMSVIEAPKKRKSKKNKSKSATKLERTPAEKLVRAQRKLARAQDNLAKICNEHGFQNTNQNAYTGEWLTNCAPNTLHYEVQPTVEPNSYAIPNTPAESHQSTIPESLQEFFDTNDLRELLQIDKPQDYTLSEFKLKILSQILKVPTEYMYKICRLLNRVETDLLQQIFTKAEIHYPNDIANDNDVPEVIPLTPTHVPRESRSIFKNNL